MDTTKQWFEWISQAIEVGAVTIIVGSFLVGSGRWALESYRRQPDAHRRYRARLGRALLISLELFVASDLVRTVAVTPTFHSLGYLAGIVLIRTFMSWSLTVDLEDRWPWQKRAAEGPAAA
jgi:uncharacterized membrane protein